jgi:hypothetical protein
MTPDFDPPLYGPVPGDVNTPNIPGEQQQTLERETKEKRMKKCRYIFTTKLQKMTSASSKQLF